MRSLRRDGFNTCLITKARTVRQKKKGRITQPSIAKSRNMQITQNTARFIYTVWPFIYWEGGGEMYQMENRLTRDWIYREGTNDTACICLFDDINSCPAFRSLQFSSIYFSMLYILLEGEQKNRLTSITLIILNFLLGAIENGTHAKREYLCTW